MDGATYVCIYAFVISVHFDENAQKNLIFEILKIKRMKKIRLS